MIDLVNNPYQIFDNSISIKLQDNIESWLTDGDNFAWFYNETSIIEEDTNYGFESYDYAQFSHAFVLDYKTNSNAKSFVFDKLINEINVNNPVIRAKANLKLMCPYGNADSHNKPHYDQDTEHFVGLYYVNNSDGYTWLFNKDRTVMKRIEPRKGRFVFFRGDILHADSHPHKCKKRLVINIDFQKEK